MRQSEPPKPAQTRGSRFRNAAPPRFEPFTVKTTIERIVPGGTGLAHADGRTLFIQDAAPGDQALVRIDRVQGRTGFGVIERLITPSPLRVAGNDPNQGPCGGCDFQHLTYDAQLAAKTEIIRDSLRRIAGIDPPAELTMIPSPRQWGYRARAEWQYDGAAGSIGSYERGTHRICLGDECAVLRPELQTMLDELRRLLAAGSLPSGRSEIRAAVGDNGTTLVPPLLGEPEKALSVSVGGETYRFDASCFFQANLDVLPALVEETLRYVDRASEQVVAENERTDEEDPLRRVAVDLYSGVGLFSLPLARHFDRVYGVDSYSRAIQYARQNADEAGLENIKLATVPVEQWLAERGRALGPVALAVVDPPRTGLDPGALQGLLRISPCWIAYVSCDPPTLARDLKQLLASGYVLESVTGIDMFPQTHHVEVVAHLRRAGPQL